MGCCVTGRLNRQLTTYERRNISGRLKGLQVGDPLARAHEFDWSPKFTLDGESYPAFRRAIQLGYDYPRESYGVAKNLRLG